MRAIVLSIERSGTTSVSQIVKNLAEANTQELVVAHESDEAAIHAENIKIFRGGGTGRLTRILRNWSHDIEVSTSLAFSMPTIGRVFGPTTKIIHLKRDREPCVDSLVRHQEFVNPERHRIFTDPDRLDGASLFRPTAVDTGEMKDNQWLKLSPRDRWLWYYDASHRAIETGLANFPHHLRLNTDDLNRPATLRVLAEFLDPAWAIPGDLRPLHINSSFFVPDHIGRDGRALLENQFKRFDWHQASRDLTYSFRYFKIMMCNYIDHFPDPKARRFFKNFMEQQAVDILKRIR